jgi:diaminopimelate decarboxylase
MPTKTLPFTKAQLEKIVAKFPTPFHIYDEAGIRQTAQYFRKTLGVLPGYRNYFAVKALPNPHILQLLKSEGMGADCSSLGELVTAERVGLRGEAIMFTSNDTPAAEFRKAAELGAIINFDDLTHILFYEKVVGSLPAIGCVRYNPGKLKQGNAIIGHPEEAKYGLTRPQVFEAYRLLASKGVKRFGLHTMVASNERNSDYFVETAEILFALVAELSKKLGITFEFVNIGGGIGIPYRPEDKPVDLGKVARGIAAAHKRIILGAKLPPLRVVTESGRAITGPHGYLVTRALHEKNTYKHYIGLDACMANLMRPALYGSYHHITVLGKEKVKPTKIYDVTGSLCENNDKFAIDRRLPEVKIGDLVVIHDTGAHGHAMGFNYNAKLRSAELLLQKGGKVKLIRRAETLEDYFATVV